jgi:hypothetical protein
MSDDLIKREEVLAELEKENEWPDDGNPAFPIMTGHTVYNQGMKLRDWFAGQALAMADALDKPTSVAQWAYEIADAMIAARKGGDT